MSAVYSYLRRGDYLFVEFYFYVSVYLCVCVQIILKRILMGASGEVERGPGRIRLDFSGDPDSFMDAGSF